MPLTKVNYIDEETVIYAQNLNDIQDAIIDLEDNKGVVDQEIEGLDNRVQAVEGDITTINQDITELDGRVDDVESVIANKATTISTNPSDDKFPTERAIYNYIASGNGGKPRILDNVDLDTVLATGFYSCNVCTHRPTENNGVMLVIKNGATSDHAVQVYWTFIADKVWVRHRDHGVWKAWKDYYTKDEVDALIDDIDTMLDGKADQADVDAIEEKIPAQATAQNQLADKNFVNSSIATNTAYYIYKEVGGQKLPFDSLAELEAYSGTLTNNDYAFVKGTDAAGNTTYTRYKYNAQTQSWAEEYVLNNSSFTATQWATINSGITSGDVELIGTALQPSALTPYRTAAEQDVIDNGKVDKVTGKGLSTEDFTTEEKVLVGTALQPNDSISQLSQDSTHRLVTDAEKELWNSKWDSVSLTVTCNTQDGVVVTGQTVTVRSGSDVTAPVFETKEYNGQPVTFTIPKGFEYFVSVSDSLPQHFAPTTASGIATSDTSVVLTYSDLSNIRTYAAVQAALTSLDDPTVMIGNVEIEDTWINEGGTSYSDPAIVVDVKQVEDEDGNTHLAAIMQRKWATARSMQFDAREMQVATGNYVADRYYYVQDASSADKFNLLVAGTDYQVGDPISGTVYDNDIKDTTGNICRYGYNNYKLSAYRQYLNSDQPVGQWWQSQHYGDVKPNELNSVRGYLAGCSAEMKAAVKAIKIQCYTNSVTDGSVIDTMYDKVWLPSGTEMYGSVNANEGTYFPYWKEAMALDAPSNAANDGRIQYSVTNHASPVYCRLRSAGRSNSYNAWNVNTSGDLNNNNANNSDAAVPALGQYTLNA